MRAFRAHHSVILILILILILVLILVLEREEHEHEHERSLFWLRRSRVMRSAEKGTAKAASSHRTPKKADQPAGNKSRYVPDVQDWAKTRQTEHARSDPLRAHGTDPGYRFPPQIDHQSGHRERTDQRL